MKKLNKEEWQKKHKEQMDKIMNKLEEGVESFFIDGGAFKDYLSVMSKFTKYSLNNTILIAFQSVGRDFEGQFAGYKDWQKKFNRHVKQGETGIQILAPRSKKIYITEKKEDGSTEESELIRTYFTPVTIFDVSQTDGEPLPSMELSGDVKDFTKLYDAIARISPVPIEFGKTDGSSKGYYSLTNKKIVVKEQMSEVQTIKTLLHEVAHATLHDEDMLKENNIKKTPMAKEIEAESVAFTVCSYFGIDTSDYSFAYVGSWSSEQDVKDLKDALAVIKTTASDFINRIEESYKVNAA